MDIQTLCSNIQMPEQMTEQILMALEELRNQFEELPINLLMEGETGLSGFQALAQALGDDPLGVKQLTCQLHCACLRHGTYRALNIPDQIYFDTMSCYTRFVVECFYYKGGYQFDRGWWTWRQLSMKVLRLGSLEYELRPDGTVAMHIPTGTDIAPTTVDASLNTAKAFFSRFFPDYENARFTCNSWLLSPVLENFLSGKSNILAFQRRFSLIKTDPQAQDYFMWLYQRLPGTPLDELPEDTSLQRKAKQWILSGGEIGNAFGYLKLDKE